MHQDFELHYSLQVFKVKVEPLTVSLLEIDAELEHTPVEISNGSFMPTRAVAQFLVC